MIRVQSVSKEYRSGRGRLNALSGVSFTIEKGATAAIYGKSGSGKTTLLNCIGGLERPEKGAINIFGADILSLSAKELSLFQRKEIGFVFQFGNLLSYLNVNENIALPLTINGVASRDKTRRVEELLEKIGLKGAGKAMPNELSGGEVQRVSFARAIAHRPKLLLADEPTASLDTATGNALVGLMSGIAKEAGSTVIVSTHDPDVIRLAQRSIHLSDGRVADM